MTAYCLATETLKHLLTTGDEVDRCYAARTLGILRDPSAINQLVECLQDKDLDVCVDAAEALGRIGAKSAVPALLESLANDPSGEVCTVVAEALGNIGSLEALEGLTRIAIDRPERMEWNDDWDTWWDVQLEAVKALGKLGNEAAVDTLLEILDDEDQQDIENQLLNALARIPGKGVDTLTERLQSLETPTLTQQRICKALSLNPNRASVKALGRALQSKKAEVRAAAANGLANSNAEHYLSALLLLLRDPIEEVRDAALKAIATLHKLEAISDKTKAQLLTYLEDSSSQVGKTLISIFNSTVMSGELSKAQTKSVLKRLNDGSAETAAAACTLLGKNKKVEALPMLITLLQSEEGHPMVRREAALALGEIGEVNEEVVQILTACVGDQQQPVRLGALSALMMLEAHHQCYGNDVQRPLQVIIEAVQGEIEIAPDHEKTVRNSHEEAISKGEVSGVFQPPKGDTSPQFKKGEALPEEFADFIQSPQAEATPTGKSERRKPPPPMEVPNTTPQIVETGEVKEATSTLNAIAMNNMEVALGIHQVSSGEAKLDEVTEEYLAVVEKNKEAMKRIRSEKNVRPEQDIRRLGVRILSESEDPIALGTLIEALYDQDSMLRREAAEAIGRIGARNQKIPELMDATGILITQLAMGNMLEKIACARALGQLGNKTALQPLIYCLSDDEPNVRIQAIDALARLTTQRADVKEVDHMAIIELSPLDVAKKLLDCMGDKDMGVRVASARAMTTISSHISDNTFINNTINSIVYSASQHTGEECRLLGRCLRHFDVGICTEKLTHALDGAKDSIKRSVYIEMIEELFNPDLGPSEQAIKA